MEIQHSDDENEDDWNKTFKNPYKPGQAQSKRGLNNSTRRTGPREPFPLLPASALLILSF